MLTAVIAGLFIIASEGHHRHHGKNIMEASKEKSQKDKKAES